MTKHFRLFLAAAAVVALPNMASAQDQILKVGYTDIGAVIGLGNIGDAGMAIGGRFERVFKDMPDMGGGTLGFGVSADVYSWSSGFSGYNYTYRYIPIGATVNYHFNLENKKFVPFVGAGLGYQIVSCDFDSAFGNLGCGGYNSTLYFIGRAGARYFLSDKMSGYADLGAGAATINIGVTFRLR